VPSKVNHLLSHATSHRGRLTRADCLSKNGYREEKCQGFVDALYECCQAFYDKNGDDATSASCPKPDLLRLKMKQRKEAKA